MIEVPHFASLRGSEREIVILRSDNGEAWREHTVESSEEVVQEILSHSFEKEGQYPSFIITLFSCCRCLSESTNQYKKKLYIS